MMLIDIPSRPLNGSNSTKRSQTVSWIQFQTAEIIIKLILVPIIILANVLIILVIKRMKTTRRPTDILVASLAVSDLLIGAVVLPLDIWRYFEVWLINSPTSTIFFCYFEFSVYLQPLCWSIQNMFLVALECLTSILIPLWHRIHVNNVLAVRVSILFWIIGTIYFILPYFLLPIGLKKRACAYAEKFNTVFITIYPNAIFFTTIILHIAIAISANLAKRGQLSTGIRQQSRSSNMLKRHLQQMIFVMFVLCWGPVSCGVLVNEFSTVTDLDNVSMRILLNLAHCNSFINCIVYLLKSKRFRQEARRVLGKRRNRVGVEMEVIQKIHLKTISGRSAFGQKELPINNSSNTLSTSNICTKANLLSM